ncbi:MAG: hypothetical protein K8H88_04025 [Sandaracinaceae bacterium]|nr:hypothetical protein [Sandaracinaceae bacterium]
MDARAVAGTTTSLAVDASFVHVAYQYAVVGGSPSLGYARRALAGSSWALETGYSALFNNGIGASIALGPDGRVHVTHSVGSPYFDQLYSTRSPAGTWSTFPIDTAAAGGGSIALDSSGGLHVAYGSGASSRYAYLAAGSSSWVARSTPEPLLGSATRPVSLVADPFQRIHLAYVLGSSPYTLRYTLYCR